MRRVKLGGLDAIVTGGTDREGGGDGPAVILLHGFGAPGDDLVSLHRVMRVPEGTRFVFPAAPIGFDTGYGEGRAWWMIDMSRFERAMVGGAPPDFSHEVPEGLPAARELVKGMLEAAVRDLKLDLSRTVLGGFSQGAMLSMDVALRTDIPFAGLLLLSGTLIARDEWLPRMPGRNTIPVFQSHGTHDPILAFSVAERLHTELDAAGFRTEWVTFRGQHEIPAPALDGATAFVNRVLAPVG
ncbi:MAG: hypothetical protein U0169_16670 [Polyangiaceae bacterium]